MSVQCHHTRIAIATVLLMHLLTNSCEKVMPSNFESVMHNMPSQWFVWTRDWEIGA